MINHQFWGLVFSRQTRMPGIHLGYGGSNCVRSENEIGQKILMQDYLRVRLFVIFSSLTSIALDAPDSASTW